MSKLTKEECIISLKELSRLRCLAKEEYDREEHAIIMLEQLINEHFELKEKYETLKQGVKHSSAYYDRLFDNKPYEFEELKKGMWVWIKDKNTYLKICDIKGKTIYFNASEIERVCILSYEFELNRFYPREVEE